MSHALLFMHDTHACNVSTPSSLSRLDLVRVSARKHKMSSAFQDELFCRRNSDKTSMCSWILFACTIHLEIVFSGMPVFCDRSLAEDFARSKTVFTPAAFNSSAFLGPIPFISVNSVSCIASLTSSYRDAGCNFFIATKIIKQAITRYTTTTKRINNSKGSPNTRVLPKASFPLTEATVTATSSSESRFTRQIS